MRSLFFPCLLGLVSIVACSSEPPESADEAASIAQRATASACAGKPDGFHCSGATLLHCVAGSVTNPGEPACANGCLPGADLGDDRCAGDECSGINVDGTYCLPDSTKVLTCTGQRTSATQTCNLGCARGDQPGHDTCRDCGPGKLQCGALCVDPASDPGHCGACGNACPNRVQGAGACIARSCGVVCNAGFGNCDGVVDNGCESTLATDASNCGGCGVKCPAGPHEGARCESAACKTSCLWGYGNCNGVATDGCETAINSDVNHCGGCGRACPVPANATARCLGASCGASCKAGYGDCNGTMNDGCETTLGTNANCGACGNVCGAGTRCTDGACVQYDPCDGVDCDPGYRCVKGVCRRSIVVCQGGNANLCPCPPNHICPQVP